MTLATGNTGTGVVTAVAVQAALKRVGIRVTIDQLPVNEQFTRIGTPATAPELMFAGWAPDWPTASTMLDRIIMQRAPVVPLVYDSTVQVHGSRVKGAYLHAFYRLWDVVSLSVV